MDVNKTTLIGRLTDKPVGTTAFSGQQTASFSVATYTSETATKLDAPQVHPVVVWGDLATIALNYLDKGARVYIEGHLTHRPGRGRAGTCTEIVADEIIMLGAAKTRTAA